MVEELKPFSIDAKAWRLRNGFTTPEWEMYVKNKRCTGIVLDTIMCFLCLIIGAVLAINNFV